MQRPFWRFGMKKELELYIHIPFCIKKCAYCDFLSEPGSEETIQSYVDALKKEIMSHQGTAQNYRVETVFFGGGTPSVLRGEQMREIFAALRETFDIAEDAEISMEANPGTVTAEKLQIYRSVGINRISFGLQSAKDEELKLLGRIHTYDEFLESYMLARQCGFDNINVDLISAIPGQSLESWEETLQKIIELQPEHISAYSLIIEEGTPFAEVYGEGCPRENELPGEAEERVIYRRTRELLAGAGYHRYEISNYAKDGKECKHNLGYWERKDYLGMGLGASSLLENTRFHNTQCMDIYLACSGKPEQIRCDVEILSETEQMEEFIFLGLRKMQGISVKEYKEYFGKTLQQCYGKNVRRMENEGMLAMDGEYLKLTEKGIDVSNYVFAEILAAT